MTIVRAIIAAVIAVAVAAGPVAGDIVTSTGSVAMAMQDAGDMPCCPGCGDHENSKSSAACALKCVNLVGTIVQETAMSGPHSDEAPPPFLNDALHSHDSSPPTHPPQA